jgi:hypothetical protein
VIVTVEVRRKKLKTAVDVAELKMPEHDSPEKTSIIEWILRDNKEAGMSASGTTRTTILPLQFGLVRIGIVQKLITEKIKRGNTRKGMDRMVA